MSITTKCILTVAIVIIILVLLACIIPICQICHYVIERRKEKKHENSVSKTS